MFNMEICNIMKNFLVWFILIIFAIFVFVLNIMPDLT